MSVNLKGREHLRWPERRWADGIEIVLKWKHCTPFPIPLLSKSSFGIARAISTDERSLTSKSPYTRECRDGFRPLLIACPMEGDRPTRLHFERRVNKARHCSETLRFLFGAIKIASLSTERAPKSIAMCFDCGCKVLVTVWFQTAEYKSAFKRAVTIFCVSTLDLRKPCESNISQEHSASIFSPHTIALPPRCYYRF